jgi:signal peptidase I
MNNDDLTQENAQLDGNANPSMEQPTAINTAPEQAQPSIRPLENNREDSIPKERKEGGIFSFIATLVIAFLLVQIINLYFFQSYKVFGSSMYPTLHNSDRLIISKISRSASKITKKTFQPERGEVIVFVDPLQPDLQLIKRVIGLPGERVVVGDGRITVYNDEHPDGFNPDDAPYGKNLPVTSGNIDITVPKGHLFVSGDNREGSNSLDSRNELGTVPQENIIGVMKVRFFPFNSAQFF